MQVKFASSFYFRPGEPCYRPDHGPDWSHRPWWKPVAVLFCAVSVHAPSTGYRLWIYTRLGTMHFDVYFDRRNGSWRRGGL